MTTKSHSPFDAFVDAYTDELIATPDEQVLEGMDAAALKAEGLDLLVKAKLEARKRRFAAAKTGLAESRKRAVETVRREIPPAEARKYVARASNDSRYTLAARNLDEMSDEDVMKVYLQMRSLEKAGESDSPDGGAD